MRCGTTTPTGATAIASRCVGRSRTERTFWTVMRARGAGGDRMKGAQRRGGCLVVSRVRARRRFGTYTVGEANKTSTIRLEASSFPNLEGTVQTRPFMITGDELRVTNPAPRSNP